MTHAAKFDLFGRMASVLSLSLWNMLFEIVCMFYTGEGEGAERGNSLIKMFDMLISATFLDFPENRIMLLLTLFYHFRLTI